MDASWFGEDVANYNWLFLSAKEVNRLEKKYGKLTEWYKFFPERDELDEEGEGEEGEGEEMEEPPPKKKEELKKSSKRVEPLPPPPPKQKKK